MRYLLARIDTGLKRSAMTLAGPNTGARLLTWVSGSNSGKSMAAKPGISFQKASDAAAAT
jgi:hypothetical protein